MYAAAAASFALNGGRASTVITRLAEPQAWKTTLHWENIFHYLMCNCCNFLIGYFKRGFGGKLDIMTFGITNAINDELYTVRTSAHANNRGPEPFTKAFPVVPFQQ